LSSTLEPDRAPHSTRRVGEWAVGRLRAAAGLGALVLLIGTGAASSIYRSSLLLVDARRWAALGPLEARRLAFGAAYVEAIESIRRELPASAPYLLVPRDAPASAGWELWVRYDLAPRRPVLIRSRADGRLSGPRGTAVPQRVDWAVVHGDGDIPLLLSRAELLARRRAPDDDR